MRLLAAAVEELQKELDDTKGPPAGFFCVTAAPLMPNEPVPEVPDLLRRINALLAAGGDVLLFRQARALQHEDSGQPLHASAGAIRRWSFPDGSSG